MNNRWKPLVVVGLAIVASLATYLGMEFLRSGLGAVEPAAVVAQGEAPIEVGVAPAGRTSFEFTGRIDQEGPTLRVYGYVTYLYDLPPGLLFTQTTNHSEATARITLSGTTTVIERTVINNIFHADAVGSITFYFDENGGASFDDLASFASGIPVGRAHARLQNVLTVTSQNTGLANGAAEMFTTDAESFNLAGVEYVIGRSGMVQRVSFAGGGVRYAAEPPIAIIAIGGAATVAGFDTFMPEVKK